MNIALVATYSHPIALGLRYISAVLKAHGHHVEMFLMQSKRATAKASFSPSLISELAERTRSADIIGMSLMTNTFHRACALTKAVRTAGHKAQIVWGGPHPTTALEESLEAADIVCIGEGEYATLELAGMLEEGKDPTAIAGLAFRSNGKIIRNPVAPLRDNLNEYPFPDYDLSTHWVAMQDHFEPATPENLRGALHRYRIETTRGCPYSCTFCTNAALMRIYRGKGTWVRKRSNENIIQEIEQARAQFPTIEAVNVIDDLFFVRSEEDIEEFSRLYEERVNLPLELDAFPNTISRTKVRSLARLPIALISMGIQSGSQDTLKHIYKRPTPLKTIVDGINILADHKIRAEYHYLVNNPFEPESNRIETLRFAAAHHRPPAILRVFPLQFYPGTPLFDRAREEGLIQDRHESAYRFTYTGKTHLLDSGYLDIWLRVVLNLRNAGVPRGAVHALVTFVTHPRVRYLLDRKWFAPFSYGVYRIGRFIMRKLIYQPFIRPLRRLRGKGRYEKRLSPEEAPLPISTRPPVPATNQAKETADWQTCATDKEV
ncbi:MAG: B12-binding domain-containing radical SAM protein [Phycisphaerales bacterium]|nr:MAG: B12-binding domain-containing radical SAM protein [Phycisphaerales bacterium]